MGVGPKSESSCQTQLTIPPFVTKRKIRDSKSYMKNLHFPRIPSGKDVNNLLQTDSQRPSCILSKSEDTIENIVMYEQTSTETCHKEEPESIQGVDSPKRLSYKSFFQQNKFSRNSSARLQLKEGLDPGAQEEQIFLKDNLRMASDVSNFLKYLRRKGTDFLTMFDLDNLNGLIDDISNMKHCAEPVSYEDSAATLRVESDTDQSELVERKSSEGCPPVFRRSVSTSMDKTFGSNTGSIRPRYEDSVEKVEKVSFHSVKQQSFHSALENSMAKLFSDGQEVGKVSSDSVKQQSFHSAVENSMTKLFSGGQEVDGKALNCVTVTRDRHVRVYIKGKSTCTTIDLCPEYVTNASGAGGAGGGRPKPDEESASEELVTDISLFGGELSSVKPIINVSPKGAAAENADGRPGPRDQPVSEKRDHHKRRHKCEISAEFQVESLHQRLLFLEVCKKLNKAKMNQSETSSSSEVAKVVSEYSETQNANILDVSGKDWKTTTTTTTRVSDDDGGAVVTTTLDSKEASVTTIDVKDQTPMVSDHHTTAGDPENLKVATKDKAPPRIVKSDFYLGRELFLAGYKRNAAGGQFCSDHVGKTDEAQCYVIETSGLADKFPGITTSGCEKADTVTVIPDEESKVSSDLKEVSAEKISLQNKTSYLDVTEGRGIDVKDSTSLGDQDVDDDDAKSEEDSHAEPRKKSHRKKVFLEIVPGKKKSPTGGVSPSKVKAGDDPSLKEALGVMCSKSADLVVGENVTWLLERVAKSSVELETFDFKFANFNQIFVGRNLETPSCSDVNLSTANWTPEKAQDSAPGGKSDSPSKELDEDQSSVGYRPKDLGRPRSVYRKRYMKKILFASEDTRDSDKAEDSSNLTSSQSNISSVFGAGSDSPDSKVRYLEEDLVCSKIFPTPKARCEQEERDEASEGNDFLTKVEEISRNMSEGFISIRSNVPPPPPPTTGMMELQVAPVIAAQRFAPSSLLTADLERIKILCEDAIQRNSCVVEEEEDDGDDVSASLADNEMARESYEQPSLSVGNASGSLEHSYCSNGSTVVAAAPEEESPEETMITTRSLLYRQESTKSAVVAAIRSDRSLVKVKNNRSSAVPSGSGSESGPGQIQSKSRAIISCRATFHADECSYGNAKRVESLVQKLCQKLSCEHPHTFNNPESFVSHFEKVGKRLYQTPIAKLRSDLKSVLGKGTRDSKPQFRREDAFRPRPKPEPKRETLDRNTKMREKIAKMKRKGSKS